MHTGPTLLIFSGLPGVGKSTIAKMLSDHPSAVYLRIDTIEQALRDLLNAQPKGEGYRLSYRMAADNLNTGHHVVADACNPIERTRREWRACATQAGANHIDIVIECSDPNEHRRRIEQRKTDIPGLKLPDWHQVAARQYDDGIRPKPSWLSILPARRLLPALPNSRPSSRPTTHRHDSARFYRGGRKPLPDTHPYAKKPNRTDHCLPERAHTFMRLRQLIKYGRHRHGPIDIFSAREKLHKRCFNIKTRIAMLEIRNATEADLKDILRIERTAFGEAEGDEIVELVENILSDKSAAPQVSLIARQNNRPVGHVLFSKARIDGRTPAVSAALLAPLAVIPEAQSVGIGGHLIDEGLYRLKEAGIEIVFVLGHPEYYPRHGFVPAGQLGFEAPYPIPDKHADAWMVQALRPNVLNGIAGKVRCCNALDQRRYWIA